MSIKVGIIATLAAVVGGVVAFSNHAKVVRLEAELQDVKKENAILLQQLDAVDSCAVINTLGDAENCY